MRTLTAFFLVVLLSGCVSGYKQFYEQAAPPQKVTELRVGPPPATPLVERMRPTETQVVLDAYIKRGYMMIGRSTFNSGQAESDNSAVQQAKEVGADLVVIFNPKYTGSVTSTIPITTPTTTTSYTSGSATAYGSGGPVTAYGNSTTTTYGSTTSYVPVTVHRSDYGAIYFIKRQFILGAILRDLSDSERKELQTNKGAAIKIVVDQTPAFDSDFLVDDIITSIDAIAVSGEQQAASLLNEKRGQLVKISLNRRGQRLEKTIRLNR